MIASNEMSHRRRVVYHGLKAHLSPASLQFALSLCDGEFAKETSFSITRFLTRLGQVDRAVEKPLLLFEHLQKLKNLPDSHIGPDPITQTLDPQDDKPSSPARSTWMMPTLVPIAKKENAPKNSNWTATANTLLNEISIIIAAANSEQAGRFQEEFPFFESENAIDQLHQRIHAAYMWLCEELGPVGADRLLSRALRSTESYPETASFPPKHLL